MMLNLEQLTAQVCAVATAVGGFLREERICFRHESIEEKHAHDYVSYVDKKAEERLVTELSTLLPEAGFVTEEGLGVYNEEAYFWVVDPLDGTTNYIHNNAPYCVSIALRSRNELLLGVVYEVCQNECFYAWKGGKAWLNAAPIQVSNVRDMGRAFVIVELPYDADSYKNTALYLIDKLYGKVSGIRMNGSAAAGICYVAAGRFDAWLEAFVGRWDYSAGALILQEAGGEITDFYGSKFFLEGHHVITTNGHLHSMFQTLIQECLPKGMNPVD